MRAALPRAIMALALACMGPGRSDWAAAMRAEFDTALAEGGALGFATGCLGAACRELVSSEEGRFTLTNYALVLGLMLPMATIQIGSAIFGLPYLYPDKTGLTGALMIGAEYEGVIRSTYQAAVPALALLLLAVGVGHMRLAWAMLERDWDRVVRTGSFTLAAAITLIVAMVTFFLNASQALVQAGVLAVELVTVAMVVRRHAQLPGATEPPG